VQLASVLDTCRPTTDNNHVHETVNLGIGHALERGGLDT
jgi:hypothetical protein